MAGGLPGVTNVTILVAASVGLIYFLVYLAPKIRDLFRPSKLSTGSGSADGNGKDKRHSDRPDLCVPCRTNVDHTLMELREHRRETIASTDRLVQSNLDLRDTMGDLRDLLRDYMTEQRALRQTGDGIRIPAPAPTRRF